MSDEKKRISVLVPVSLLNELKEKSNLNITEATIKGLELILKSDDNIENNIQRDENNINAHQILLTENAGLREINGMLKRELEASRQDKEDFRQIHTNYMAQMQMILTQKAIEAPKTPEHKSMKDKTPDSKIGKTCLQCSETFVAKNASAKYCSEKCRSAWRRQNK
jgi:hypothetical protein